MWTLRRASSSLKKQGFILGFSQNRYATSEISSRYSEGCTDGLKGASNVMSNSSLPFLGFHMKTHGSPKLLLGSRSFSSPADIKSNRETDSDSDDGFSELESPIAAEGVLESELVSEPELSEEDVDGENVEAPHDELELSDTEANGDQPMSPRKRVSSGLFEAIEAASTTSVLTAMVKWAEEGNDLTREEISLVMVNLRKRRMFLKALKLSEWLELKKNHPFTERDYASRVDLLAKVRGLQKAESYIENIPASFRNEVVYRTLLANYVSEGDVKKSEAIFNKMKDLEFSLTCFTYNQLLILYKRFDRNKIADVLLLMEKENVKPTDFTYKILIDAKGQSNDITGMEQIVETMKAEGIEPDIHTKGVMAKHYIYGGLNEKAENILKVIEGDINKNRSACRILFPLYAALGKADEVSRIWQVCEPNARLDECMVAVEAWGKLHKIEEAEAVFEKMSKKVQKLSPKHYTALLKVYASHKMLAKGKDLMKRMSDSGCRIGPLTWDALIKLYIEAGEVEKADSILHEAAEQNRMKPMITSYIAIMEQYAKRGDIQNSEKLFHRMKLAGYAPRLRQFQSLVQAYINAKAPCYGIAERMKADNVFPNRFVANMLAQVDAFKKTALSELLD